MAANDTDVEAIEHICRAERAETPAEARKELDAARTAIDSLELQQLAKAEQRIHERQGQIRGGRQPLGTGGVTAGAPRDAGTLQRDDRDLS